MMRVVRDKGGLGTFAVGGLVRGLVILLLIVGMLAWSINAPEQAGPLVRATITGFTAFGRARPRGIGLLLPLACRRRRTPAAACR